MDRRYTSPIAKSARFVASGWLTSLKREQCAAVASGFGDVDGNGAEVRLQHCLEVLNMLKITSGCDSYNHKLSGLIHAPATVKLYWEMVHLVSKTVKAQVPVLRTLWSQCYRFPPVYW